MGHISGINPGAAGQINPNQNMNQLHDLMQSVNELMADLMNTTEEGAQNISATGRGREGVQNQSGHTATFAQEAPRAETLLPTEAEIAAAASQQSEDIDEVKKRKRKEKAFKEKLQQLKSLVSNMDLESLDPEDKAVIEEFLRNADTIGNLQNKLQFLEDKEIYYMGLLEKKKQG